MYISKIFGFQSHDDQKNKKFKELEEQFEENQEMLDFVKASWLVSRGNNLGLQGKIDEAIIDFKESIKLKQDYIPAYVSLGTAYREKRMISDALFILNSAPRRMKIFGKEIDGFEFDLYNAIAAVYLLMGDKVKTIEYAKIALEAANNPKRKEQIKFAKQSGVIYEKENDDLEMIEILKSIIQELEEK